MSKLKWKMLSDCAPPVGKRVLIKVSNGVYLPTGPTVGIGKITSYEQDKPNPKIGYTTNLKWNPIWEIETELSRGDVIYWSHLLGLN